MGLTLYTARFDSVPVIGCSPPSWAVWLACLEKGIRFEHHQLDFGQGEHKSPQFLEKNPKGTLPALFDDDRLVSETRPMLECIQRQPGPTLLGETPQQRSFGLRQLTMAGQLKDAGMAWLSAMMHNEPEAIELGDIYAQHLQKLADAFSTSTFLAPPDSAESRPGLADFLCYAYVATAAHLSVSLAKWPRIVTWLGAMERRESVRTTRPASFG